MHPKMLLLQARNADDPCKEEERRSFANKLRMPEEQIISCNLLKGAPSLREVRRFDALLMGGSGDYYVSKRNLPDFPALLELLAEVADVGHPTFASCFGFQCMVLALGGEIVHDPENTQVGTYPLSLTKAGREDPLLGRLPEPFMAQLGRKDRAARLPEAALHLATSEACPYQAFRIPGKPVWATQFHPELDEQTNRGRFMNYLDGYAAHLTPQELNRLLEQFTESPETEDLLPAFVRLVFG